jgi:hypothetical protein
MNTSTPNLLQVGSIKGMGKVAFPGDDADAESIVLFVGHPHKEMLTEK